MTAPAPSMTEAAVRSDFRFRRDEHLKGRNEIREVFGKGKRYGCQGAKLFVLKSNLPHNRICFTLGKISKGNSASKGNASRGNASRGSRNAVARNRARRLAREAYRLMKPRLVGGYDLILLVYPETEMTLSGRASQLESLFRKAGLLR
ncbi:MAG: ribonuclease P protein component [Treponema sp.]|jgi:ribonuclease P protein component|nr:ribonuclease P protein component [Treponema sp.]